jgi:hypothetical protein
MHSLHHYLLETSFFFQCFRGHGIPERMFLGML